MVDTEIFRKSGATPDMLPMDDGKSNFVHDSGKLLRSDIVKLSAAFTVWITLPEAQFLNGKWVWVNWDVEELEAKAEEISSGTQFTAGIYGWPFSP